MIYSGIVKYEEADIAFLFDEKTLSLYPSFELFNRIVMYQTGTSLCYKNTKKPLTDGFIEGKVNGQTMIIHFFFDPLDYATIQKNLLECEIKIFVKKYIKYNCNFHFPAKDITLRYSSKQLHRFLNLIPQYEISPDISNGFCGKVSCNTETTKLVSCGAIDGAEISMSPSYSCSWGGSRFSFNPEILIKVSEIRDEKHLLKIYEAIIKFIKYAFMRIDITPEKFYIQDNNKFGEICSMMSSNTDSTPEDCNSIWQDSIPWRILYKYAIKILDGIYSNDWYLDNIPQTKDERLYVSEITISKEAAAFEHEFTKHFPDGLPTHSQNRIIAENEVEREITPLFESAKGKKRKIYKGFILHIRNEALADKIEYCLNTFEPCIEWFKNKIANKYSNETLSDICANIRNDIDHGNKVLDLDTDVAKAYGILRALNYAMQLKRVGYNTNEINTAIKCLFFMKGFAP